MNFTAEHMAEIFTALGHRPSKQAGSDKRRATRLPHRATVTIVPWLGGIPGLPIEVQLMDFSPRGVRLMLETRLENGSEFIILLPRQHQQPVPILCTAVHVRDGDAGRFNVGAEFVCIAQGFDASGELETVNRARIQKSILD